MCGHLGVSCFGVRCPPPPDRGLFLRRNTDRQISILLKNGGLKTDQNRQINIIECIDIVIRTWAGVCRLFLFKFCSQNNARFFHTSIVCSRILRTYQKRLRNEPKMAFAKTYNYAKNTLRLFIGYFRVHRNHLWEKYSPRNIQSMSKDRFKKK